MDDTLGSNLKSTLIRHQQAAAGDPEQTAPTASTNRYELGRELGRGGMGRVVEAIDRQFDRVVAVKEMFGDASGEAMARFQTEALVTGNLEHPGIPAVHERGVAQGVAFYVMQRVVGRSLSVAVAAAPSLAERLALLPSVIKVAHTVGFAHERGVIHRDLKPENVLLGAHGEVSVVDWGIAKVRGVADSTGPRVTPLAGSGHATTVGAVMGTPAYMAPEQAAGEVERIDERTDVFALGALLFHVLTGRPPYQGSTVEQVVAHARRADPLVLGTEVPAALRDICRRATARDPAQRYLNAGQLAAALEAFTTNAVVGDSGLARWVGNGLSAVVVLALVALTFGLWLTSPSVQEQGTLSLAVLAIALSGLALAAIDLITGGRQRFGQLVVSVAAATFVLSVGVTAIQQIAVLNTMLGRARHPDTAFAAKMLSDGSEFKRVGMTGTREALGNLPVACGLCAGQLVLWGLARRRERVRADSPL